ncbi:hypothetical protein [Pedobacter nototheniae]|uniref:hypothetical protein n=1 Tax=Pedobacter nototheniae TaxID=2488994 RepID=UPI00103A7E90|nr:hypothetical protein [Pedobacter nototheniae]
MNRASKIILYSIFIIPVILLFSFFFWLVFFDGTTEEVIKDSDLAENFAGKVDSLYFDKQNHNIKIAVLASGYKYQIFRRWEYKIKIGDSLSKRKGSLELIIYKDGEVKAILDYRDTYRK